MATSALERYLEKKAKQDQELQALKNEAISEIAKRRSELKEELAKLDKEYEDLTGKSPTTGERIRKSTGGGPKADIADEKELADILKKAGNKLNRKGFNRLGYNLRSAIKIAKGDAKKFGFSQNGPQGEVWLK